MKAALKKLSTLNRFSLLRNVFFSFLFVLFFVLVLYVLINSPA
ncbi:MAG TPA: hypothetical protein VI385_07640 [Flavisolibacter sp.]